MSLQIMSLKGRLKGFLAGMGLALSLALPSLAQPGMAQATAPNRLALVIGEASYIGDPLQTTANDAALMAQSLRAQGFAVTELHDLNTANLAAQYQAFLAGVRQAPPGVAVSVYLGGLAVTVGCDDYLLPVDAQIHAQSDVPGISLSMKRMMSDLSQISATMNLVMLDGARPIPQSVSSVSFARGLMGLTPPTATSFSLSAEVHDMLPDPLPTDQTDAYTAAFANVSATPTPDSETMLHLLRLDVHQATAGAQTPWQQTSTAATPFVFDLSATQATIQAASASLLSDAGPLTGMDPQTAYYTAIWRNNIPTFQDYLAQFSTTGDPAEVARAQVLLQLLEIPNPVCAGQQATLPLPILPVPVLPPPVVVGGPGCPPGYIMGYEDDGDAYCTPPITIINCPPGFDPHWVDGHMNCWWHCPPVNFRRWEQDHWRCFICPPGQQPRLINGHWVCHIPCLPVQNGLGAYPEPWCCPPGSIPERTGHGWVCGQPPCPVVNGGIITRHVCCPPGEHKVRNGIDTFTCQPNVPPNCLQGTLNCPPPPPPPCLRALNRNNCPPPPPPPCLRSLDRNNCPPPPPTCPPGEMRNVDGRCVPGHLPPNCPVGEHRMPAGGCVPNVPIVTFCPRGTHHPAGSNACVPDVIGPTHPPAQPTCPNGEHPIPGGCAPNVVFRPIPPRPPIVGRSPPVIQPPVFHPPVIPHPVIPRPVLHAPALHPPVIHPPVLPRQPEPPVRIQ